MHQIHHKDDDPRNNALDNLSVDRIHYLDELGCYRIEERPLRWQQQGLQQTASGYGRKLTSTRMVQMIDKHGHALPTQWSRWRRVYVTQVSNAGSAWVTVKGKRYFLRGAD